MARRFRAERLAPLLAMAAIVAGCGEEFPPPYRLTSLRVLAIRSEPVAPATGETTTLSTLVYTTDPVNTPVSYEWTWCPFAGPSTEGYPCLVTEEQAAQLAGQSGAVFPSFALGTGPTATLENSIDPAILAQVCAGIPGAPAKPDCEHGFPVQVKVRVTTPTDEIVAVRRLRLRFDAASSPNTNPVVDGLGVMIGDVEQPIDGPAAGTVTVPREEEAVLRARVSQDVVESFTDTDGATVAERVFLSWFVENGDLQFGRTGGATSRDVPFETMLENEWTPAAVEDAPATTARILVVIRDSRDGVGWHEGAVLLGDAQ